LTINRHLLSHTDNNIGIIYAARQPKVNISDSIIGRIYDIVLIHNIEETNNG